MLSKYRAKTDWISIVGLQSKAVNMELTIVSKWLTVVSPVRNPDFVGFCRVIKIQDDNVGSGQFRPFYFENGMYGGLKKAKCNN